MSWHITKFWADFLWIFAIITIQQNNFQFYKIKKLTATQTKDHRLPSTFFWVWSKRWWGVIGISWTICKSFAPCSRQIIMPAPHHSIVYRPDALNDAYQQCQSTEGKRRRQTNAKISVLDYHNHHHTTVLWPFFRDHLGEPVPEENFWSLWCKGRLTGRQTDHPTGRHSIRTNQCPPPPDQITIKSANIWSLTKW